MAARIVAAQPDTRIRENPQIVESCRLRRVALRIALGLGALALVLLVAAQLFLPRLVADGVEERLTEGGGEAEVSVEAVPAARLVFGDGDRIEVRGSDLVLDVEDRPDVLDRLDGFGEVDVDLERVEAGPFEVSSFELAGEGGGGYRLRSSAVTSGVELIEYGAGRLGGLAGPVAGFLTDDAPEEARRELPVELDMELRSADGEIEVVSGTGTVAGFDTGPVAEVITGAIVAQL